jgi:DNA-binding transcriptional MerR regulator
MDTKFYTTSGAARYAECSEATVRRADRAGVIRCARDTSNRRLLTQLQADKLREYVQQRRAG